MCNIFSFYWTDWYELGVLAQAKGGLYSLAVGEVSQAVDDDDELYEIFQRYPNNGKIGLEKLWIGPILPIFKI